MLKYLRRLTGRGDTIVEVMVVLAVLGLAIAISYATANRSLLNVRQAQENSQATELVQAQIEDLRYLAGSGTTNSSDPDYNAADNIFNQSHPFCVTNLTSTPPAFSTATCNTSNGSTFDTTSLYTLLIYSCDKWTASPCNDAYTGPGTDAFIVQAEWPDVLGQGTDTVTQTYRVYPGLGL